MGTESPSPRQLLVEAIIFWSIAVVLVGCRIVSRVLANGSFRRLSFDDYVMVATFIIYTALLVLIQISSRYATNLMDPEEYPTVLANPQEVRDRILGSKVVIGVEQCMLISTWGVKACMLTLFWRLTKNLRLQVYVKIIAVYSALGFAVIMVTYYAVFCRPFSQYWAMPVHDMQCATYQHYSITQAVFNITSDVAMLAIPIPLMIKSQMRTRKKILLISIMSLGIFTIVAAILNKVFNFASPLTTMYQLWYIREASTAMYVANLICLWPLLRKLFGLKAFRSNSRPYRQRGPSDNKECLGASGSPGTTENSSYSRPSFSFPRVLLSHKQGGRKILRGLDPSVKPEPPSGSEEGINDGSAKNSDGTRDVQLDTWAHKEINENDANSRPYATGDLETGATRHNHVATSEPRTTASTLNVTVSRDT
ncbi:hypothetical protein FE257_012310 [Aspergillus nanangensis]|uniref:Rhodopsin domain-containing protein n=1 Tax=Aspergillus nanangensis TaxID=2582783 RepID=A0AAD4GRX8_ASPNN|nr:hypothetical protein FE257_012310 [Aspergillus nanangensis]